MAKVIIDPGHGGRDSGASYQEREEKNDVLELSMAIGEILTQNGVEVMYTRTDDVYNTPYEKAVIGNNSGADYFVSIHRNASNTPGMYNGAQVLVYEDSGVAGQIARNIQSNMVDVGFDDEGVVERKDLAVLRRTNMPAVLVEAGFIDNPGDNQIFDARFEELAQAIADGILENIPAPANNSVREATTKTMPLVPPTPEQPPMSSMPETPMEPRRPNRPGNRNLYQVQVGAYRNYQYANQLLQQLTNEGYPAFIVYDDNLYRVRVGAYMYLENAVVMEGRLRAAGYNTYITT